MTDAALFYIFMAVFLFISTSGYYRYTALILAASCLIYAVTQPLLEAMTYFTPFIYYIFVDFLTLCAMAKWGDERKDWQCWILLTAIIGNIACLVNYGTGLYAGYEFLNLEGMKYGFYALTLAQVGVMRDGIGDAFRFYRSKFGGLLSGVFNNIRTDP